MWFLALSTEKCIMKKTSYSNLLLLFLWVTLHLIPFYLRTFYNKLIAFLLLIHFQLTTS